jgi:hypothetical protein
MSLDFVVLDKNETPQRSVNIGVDLHYALIKQAANLGLSEFNGFSDHYEDSQVSIQNLPSLLKQLKILRSQTNLTDLQFFLDELDSLIVFALSEQKAVYELAD